MIYNDYIEIEALHIIENHNMIHLYCYPTARIFPDLDNHSAESQYTVSHKFNNYETCQFILTKSLVQQIINAQNLLDCYQINSCIITIENINWVKCGKAADENKALSGSANLIAKNKKLFFEHLVSVTELNKTDDYQTIKLISQEFALEEISADLKTILVRLLDDGSYRKYSCSLQENLTYKSEIIDN